jgi:hypothetical protein
MVDMNKVKAFHAAHAVGGPSVQWDGFIYYADGSYRDVDPVGVLAEPPSSDFERLSNIVTYHKARLAKTITAFQDLKEQLLSSGPEQEEGLAKLAGLKAEVKKRRAALNKAEQNLALTETAQARRGHEEFLHEERQRQSAWRARVKEVQLS